MDNLNYYFSIFRRRLPYFLIVVTALSALSVTVAFTLPPAYESRMVLLVESPQIPEELASSTVQTPVFEQLQVIEQRLLTRKNLLQIARKFDVLPNLNNLNPDEIVSAMRARTVIKISNTFRQGAPLMTITFEAPLARTAAEVLNEYLLLIQQQDANFRKGRSSETLAFFTQEVARLGQDLDAQSARILELKQANSEALPESLAFRLDQLSVFQDRLIQAEREIADLRSQRSRLLQLYELTGDVQTARELPRSADETQLEVLNNQLAEALAVYSLENPRVKILKTRIEKLKAKIQGAAPDTPEPESPPLEPVDEFPPVMVIQLEEIDNRISSLEEQKSSVEVHIQKLDENIAKTPEVAINLEEMNRRYEAIESQYNLAESRLSKAQIGDRIETRSRGQKLSVIEQPAVPSEPTKPNRLRIAGAGVAFGILTGFGLLFLIEILNTSARRPEDIINKLGVTPLTTIPYIETRGERFRRRARKLLVILAILVGIPAAVYAVHTHYMPLDLLADKVMNKVGVRW